MLLQLLQYEQFSMCLKTVILVGVMCYFILQIQWLFRSPGYVDYRPRNFYTHDYLTELFREKYFSTFSVLFPTLCYLCLIINVLHIEKKIIPKGFNNHGL